MPPSDPETTRWFEDAVQPHESDLRAYLRAKFSAYPDIEDLIQETYARLLQAREEAAQPIGKAYLFATARNAAIDFFRRRKIAVIESIADIELLPVLEDRPDVAESVSLNQELTLLAEAIQSLPARSNSPALPSLSADSWAREGAASATLRCLPSWLAN